MEKTTQTQTQIRRDQIEVRPLSDTQTGHWGSLSYGDAPFALIIHTCQETGHVCPDACAVWGLSREMSIDEAWADYDYADQYEVED